MLLHVLEKSNSALQLPAVDSLGGLAGVLEGNSQVGTAGAGRLGGLDLGGGVSDLFIESEKEEHRQRWSVVVQYAMPLASLSELNGRRRSVQQHFCIADCIAEHTDRRFYFISFFNQTIHLCLSSFRRAGTHHLDDLNGVADSTTWIRGLELRSSELLPPPSACCYRCSLTDLGNSLGFGCPPWSV